MAYLTLCLCNNSTFHIILESFFFCIFLIFEGGVTEIVCHVFLVG